MGADSVSVVDEGEGARVASLLADVYDAALDPELWPRALESLCGFTGATASFLYFQDLAGVAGDACYAFGDDPGRREALFRSYAKLNPANGSGMRLLVGEVGAASSLLGVERLRALRLHEEWLRPQALGDLATVVLARSNLSVTCLTVATREEEGCADPDLLAGFRLAAPHFQRAAAIAEMLGQRTIEAATLGAVLDRLSLAVFLVDAEGEVVHANAQGRAMLHQATVLNCWRDVLSATDRASDRALRQALAETGRGGVSDRGPLEAVGSDGSEHLIYILPLTSGARLEAGSRLSAASVVFVQEENAGLSASAEALARLYGLTAGEIRVLRALVDGGGTREVADALGLSENTVNTHLRHLFEKTGVRRQADLLKLMATHVVPIEARALAGSH